MNEWASFNFKRNFLLTEGRNPTSFGLPTWTHASCSTHCGSWRWRQSSFTWGRLFATFGSSMWTLARSWIIARQRWILHASSICLLQAFFSVSQFCWQLLNGVSKKMSDVKDAILVSWNQLILTNLTYIKQTYLTDFQTQNGLGITLFFIHTGQEMPKTQLCCSFVIEGRPLRPSSNSCYATAHDGCWAIRYQMRSLGNMLH